MVSFRDAAANSLRGALCAVIAINDDGARLFGRVPGLQTGADYFNFFAPLRGLLCNDDPADVPTPQPPFTGGQCSGVNYNITWTGTVYPFSDCSGPINTGSTLIGVPGPITNLRGAIDPVSPNPACASQNIYYFDFGPSGTRQTLFGQGNGAVLNSFSVTRTDGQPDNCGDPPLVVPPPGPVTRPVNITYNNEDNDVIDIDGDVVFSPFFSVGDLDIRVPFNLDLGGLEFSGTIQISPEFNFEISPRVYLGGPGVPDDPDGLPTIPPEDTEPVDDPEDEPLIIGVIVRSSPVGELRQTAIATEGQPTIYAPRIGSCSFAIENSLTVSWTSDIPIKNRDNYIPCPEPRGAVGVSVSAEPGWEIFWTAVRGRPLT